jgi:transposase
MHIETLDQLLQVLERATQATEALKKEIAAEDGKGITVQSTELVKALITINELYEEIMK